MMAAARPADAPTDPGHALLVQLLTEIRGVRDAVTTLAERMGAMERAQAAHPPADAMQEALARLRVIESREADIKRVLDECRADLRTMTTRVEALERSEARGGVTLSAAHKVAAAGLGLITLSLVALVGYLWRR